MELKIKNLFVHSTAVAALSLRRYCLIMLSAFLMALTSNSYGQSVSSLVVPPSSLAPEVYFVNLRDGDRVRSPFRIIFGLTRLGLAPAGIDKPSTGHHHLLINTALPSDLKKPLPFSDKYRHFGGGQSEAIIEMPPGKHTLRLLFADSLHQPFVKTTSGESIVVLSRQITIEVMP